MEGFRQPHPSQLWLVDAFFRLHRRRDYSEVGPKPIPYSDMVILADNILCALPFAKQVFFKVIEETDYAVLEFLFNRNAVKLEEATTPTKGKK